MTGLLAFERPPIRRATRWLVVVLASLAAGAVVAAIAPAVAAAATASTMLAEPAAGSPAAANAPSDSSTPAPLAAASARSATPKPGSGGWYWPIGTEDFQGWDSWLQPRGSYVHIAQDMPCAVGHPVYAIGDGVVFISRADTGGYGVNGTNGGCIIISHVTASGIKFHALYGHVSDLRVKDGEHVAAGQVIAKVNGCAHLHFSIHPGTKYRDGNPYAGHVPKSWADHGGYVDPVKFMRTNPRVANYRPPALPVTEIETKHAPLRTGAVDGYAYWTEDTGGASVTYRYDLATGAHRALRDGEDVPTFDTDRYTTADLAAPAVGFSVSDHRPAFDLTVADATPLWGMDAELTATLKNAAGAPLRGAFVHLQRQNGDRWVEAFIGVTDASGTAQFAYTTTVKAVLRVAFVPPPDTSGARGYVASHSATVGVTPGTFVSAPRVPATVKRLELITIGGSVAPALAAGDEEPTLAFQRRGSGGVWVPKFTAAATVTRAGGQTRYVARAHVPAAGTWRVCAKLPAGTDHAATTSTWSVFVVK